MVLIVFGVLFFLAALTLLTIAVSNTGDEKRFNRRCEKSEAEIIEYFRDDAVKQNIPLVSFSLHNAVIRCPCKAINMSEETHPPGTPIQIAFCKRIKDGAEYYDVRIDDPEYAPFQTSSAIRSIATVCVVFAVLSGICTTIGLLII